MKSIRLVIPGDPVAQGRPRACIRGKHASVYSNQQKEMRDFQVKALERFFEKPIDEAVVVKMRFYLRRPKSHYGTGKNAGILKPSAPRYHAQKPDTSNLIKFAEDALNGILWTDDAIIIEIIGSKAWANNSDPRTEIDVRKIWGGSKR